MELEKTALEKTLRARRLLLGASVAVAVGIAVAGSVSRSVGGVILVAAWLGLVAGIHAYGRTGAT